MNILLTNDDGFDSIGISILKDKLSKYGRVIICAPKVHMSGKSTSITLDRPLKLIEESKDVYSLDGTPADCVVFGLTNLDIKFDIVVSGCNEGWNLSFDTHYSGTIGACRQALIFEVPSIAFSCECGFDILDKSFDIAYSYINDNNLLSTDYLINVNFPNAKSFLGIKESKLYLRKCDYWYEKNEHGYISKRKFVEKCLPEDSDIFIVEQGYISFTKIPLF